MRRRAAQAHVPDRRHRRAAPERAASQHGSTPRRRARSSACRSWPRKVRMLFGDRDITPDDEPHADAIDAGPRRATFRDRSRPGPKRMDYDYIHVIPPQRAPEFVRQSGLAWADRWTDQGWVECDMQTLRHLRYPEIWALGDVAGVPKGKTAASVKWQVPVVEDHLVAAIEGREGTETYNGYTSCPLITRIGRAMLVEFDYNNNLTPFLPRHDRAAGRAVDQLADEGGRAEGHLQRHAARPRLRRTRHERPDIWNPDRRLRRDLRTRPVLGHGRCGGPRHAGLSLRAHSGPRLSWRKFLFAQLSCPSARCWPSGS
jgi:hypothetical protein